MLIISIAANVFLGGFVVGRVLNGPHQHPRVVSFSGDFGSQRAFRDLDALSPEERQAFRAVFKGKKRELRKNFHDTLKLRAAFGEALAADPWDRGRVEAARAALAAEEGVRATTLAALLIEAFEALPADKRKALVEKASMRSDPQRSRRGRRRDGRDHPPKKDPPLGDDAPAPAPAPSDDAPMPPPD